MKKLMNDILQLELLASLLEGLLVFVYHYFDQFVIRAYSRGPVRPKQVDLFFLIGVPA